MARNCKTSDYFCEESFRFKAVIDIVFALVAPDI